MNEISSSNGAGPEPTGVDSGSKRPAILGMALWFYGAMLGLALAIAWFRGAPLPWAPVSSAWLPALLLGGLGAALTIGVSEWMTRRTRWGAALSRALALQIGPIPHITCWGLALVSGIGEEALFRGALQPWLGFAAASALFGLAHFVPRREFLPWTGFALLAGLGLGALFETTGNLLAPICAHVVVNGINLRRMTRDLPRP